MKNCKGSSNFLNGPLPARDTFDVHEINVYNILFVPCFMKLVNNNFEKIPSFLEILKNCRIQIHKCYQIGDIFMTLIF